MKIRKSTSKESVSIKGENKKGLLFWKGGKSHRIYRKSDYKTEEIMIEKNRLSIEKNSTLSGIVIERKENKISCSFVRNKEVQQK